LWDQIEPYPYGDYILNIVTTVVVSPILANQLIYFIIEMFAQFGYSFSNDETAPYKVKFNLPCLPSK